MNNLKKKLSGAQFRKEAKKRCLQLSKQIESTPKIDVLFSKRDMPVDNTTCRLEKNTALQEDTVAENPENEAVDCDRERCENACLTDNCGTVHVGDPEHTVLLGLSPDPAHWDLSEATRQYVAANGFKQNMDVDFSKSKRQFGSKCRMLTKAMFEKHLINDEKVMRHYLVYSESTGRLFCAPCRLFGSKSSLAVNGFCDWKNCAIRLDAHERSAEHKTCVLSMQIRGNALGKINKMLTEELVQETNYWRNVLKRVVSVVRALGTHGLAFRGRDDKFGSSHGGNFKMLLEVIAEYDAFLADHICKYGNAGKGRVSYLSFATCEEFVQVMGDEVLKHIIKETKKEKYFSISVDSTPDVSHVDQLSFIVRYIKENGSPAERFLCFIPNPGHGAQQLAEVVMDTLKEYDLNIRDCRGQSYDNASNLSGQYSGLQARIKQINPLAVYIPCAAHSLNLVGTCAAESCREACAFFEVLQHLYVFFTSSTGRWEVLRKHLKASSTLTVKRLSETRWSARDEACRSLNRGFTEILEALKEIEEDVSEKATTRNSACGLLRQLKRLETAFMAVFWGSLLERFQAVSRNLQKVDIDVSTVVELYESLTQYVKDTREMFDSYESDALTKSIKKEYDIRHRKNLRNAAADQHELRRDFSINTFYVICDSIISELERRKLAYKDFFGKFEFLLKLTKFEKTVVVQKAKELAHTYDNDLDVSEFVEECLHLRAHLKTINYENGSALSIFNKIRTEGLQTIYHNVDIAFKIFLCTPATNCSAERSFSTLKRIKNYLRSTMTEDRLNALAILAIESDLAKSLNYDDVIDKFASQRARRKKI